MLSPGPPASEGTAPALFAALIPILSSLPCSLACYPKQLQGFFCTNYKGISQIGEFRVSHSENALDEIAVKGRTAQGAPGIGLGSPPALPSPTYLQLGCTGTGGSLPGCACAKEKGCQSPKVPVTAQHRQEEQGLASYSVQHLSSVIKQQQNHTKPEQFPPYFPFALSILENLGNWHLPSTAAVPASPHFIYCLPSPYHSSKHLSQSQYLHFK